MGVLTGYAMTRADEYRRIAAECQTIATQCKDQRARELWLETAGTWLRIAELNQNTSQLAPTTEP